MEANFEFSCPKKLSRCPKLDGYAIANFGAAGNLFSCISLDSDRFDTNFSLKKRLHQSSSTRNKSSNTMFKRFKLRII